MTIRRILIALSFTGTLAAQPDTSPPIAVYQREVQDGGLQNTNDQRDREGNQVVLAAQPPIDRDAPDEDGNEDARSYYKWQKRQAQAEVGLFALGVVGAIAIYLQLWQLRKSNRQTQISNQLTRESNEAAVRAFRHDARARLTAVKFESLGTHPIYGDRAYCPIRITVVNVGNSDTLVTLRADIVYSRFSARFTPEFLTRFAEVLEKIPEFPPRPKPEKLPLAWPSVDVPLRKGASTDLIWRLKTPEQPPPELGAFNAGAVQADLVGWLLSRDELGETRRTYVGASIDAAACLKQHTEFGRLAKEEELPVSQLWEWRPIVDNNQEYEYQDTAEDHL